MQDYGVRISKDHPKDLVFEEDGCIRTLESDSSDVYIEVLGWLRQEVAWCSKLQKGWSNKKGGRDFS